MRSSIRAIVAAVLAAAAAPVAVNAQVVISQVTGNGGLTGDVFDRDYVELFNRGSTTVSLNGWSLQLFGDSGSSTTPATPNWTRLPLSGSIQPGQYLLVVPVTIRGGLGAAFAFPPLIPADLIATDISERNLSPSANAVALLNSTATLANGECPVGRSDLVDMIRYGLSNALCFEGSGPAIAPTSGSRAIFRLSDGCFDSNDSSGDITTGQFSAPRNSSVNGFVSSTFATPTVTTGAANAARIEVVRGTSTCNPITSTLTSATANLSAFGLSTSQPLFDNGTNGDLVAGDGKFSFAFTIPAGQAPGRYDVITSGSNGIVTLPSTAVLRVLPTPASNDFCSNAVALSGSGTLFNGQINTTLATSDADAGTCNGDAETKFSVWFSYTPATTGAIRIDETSSEDVVTSIFNACGGVSLACIRNDIGSSTPVAAGVPIWIQVGQETGAGNPPQVALDLTLTFEAAPVNDEPCGAITIPLNTPLVATPNAAATAAIESNGLGVSCDQGANPPEARRGVWYTITTGATGGNLEFLERSSNFAVMTVFTAANCNGPFGEVGCVTESSTGPILTLQPNTTYFVLVSLSTFSTIPSVPYDLTLTFFQNPANDLACGAEAITTLPATRTVPAKGATVDPSTGTSSACTGSANRLFGVWYTYTSGPSETGVLRVSDTSSNDLFYVSYTGSDCNSLTPYQCYGAFTNDDIFITLQPSTQYWILVSLESTTASSLPNGSYQLNFERFPVPANDLACNATFVNVPSFHDIVAGPAATPDIDLSCNYNIPVQTTTGYGVWYRFAPTTSKLLKIDNAASDVLVFGLFTGADCNSLTEVTCRQGSNSPLSDNFAFFELTGGQQYWLLTGKIANSQPFGLFDLTIELLDPQGACCSGTTCTITTQATCVGNFRGPFTTCGDVPNFEDIAATPIPDSTSGTGGTPGVITRTINVPATGTVNDLKVLVDINHLRIGDLIMTIQGPGGGVQDLMRRIDDDNDLNCPTQGQQGRLSDLAGVYIFDDQAVNPYGPSISQAARYFDSSNVFVIGGHYLPVTCNDVVVNLNSAFIGQTMTGTWTLTISDNQSSSTGTLNRWGLIINGGQIAPCACRADFNGNGSVTVQDIFDFLSAYFSGLPSADINGVGGVTVQDIFDYLALYFTGC